MKKMRLTVLTCFVALFFVTFSTISNAQNAKPQKSPKASVMQRVGADTDIVIDYSRPAVKKRVIWGELVPYGMYPGNKYSKEKPFPWRAGANQNTTIEFNHDLLIEGKKIAAGKYGIHMLVSENDVKIMFNKANDAWGSYSYNADENAIVVTVVQVKVGDTEWLEYGFDNLTDNSATAYLQWEKIKIPFKIKLAE
jgi:hypothetical protein